MKNYIPVSTSILDATKVCCEKSNISGNGAQIFTNILDISNKKSLKISKGGNQNPYIEEDQTTQWPMEKVQKDKQRSTKHTYKTKDQVTRIPLKTGSKHVLKNYIPVSTIILDSSSESMLRGVKQQWQRGVNFPKHITNILDISNQIML